MTVATRTDEEIKKDVVDQLYWDVRVDASDVKIQVSEGQVTLTGTVPNYTVYEAASEDVWSIFGVMYVQNDLIIKYPPELKVSTDAEIRSNIEKILLWQPNINSMDIDVFVENGWVSLRGSVDAYWKKVRAEVLTLSMSGVLGVTNELAVVPTGEFEDKAIADDIEAAFERNVSIDQNLIDLKVKNAMVTLEGSVPSLPAFRAAQKIAENTLGVRMVDNELVIR